MNNYSKPVFLIAALMLLALPASARPQRFEAADSKGVMATRSGNVVSLKIDADVKSPIKIPRLAAPLVSMVWVGTLQDGGLKLKPEPDHWVISWKDRPKGANLMLTFGAAPLLLSEVKPVGASADGSFYLPAHLALTQGEKIRYEPQPFKNTVGYWVGKKDTATWQVKLDKPGRFNVAILQGCGKGQGGSSATLQFGRQVVNGLDTSLEFNVIETGHFQNFKWRHLGEVKLDNSGVVSVTIIPGKIKKAALMDVRAIHLVRLPDKKK